MDYVRLCLKKKRKREICSIWNRYNLEKMEINDFGLIIGISVFGGGNEKYGKFYFDRIIRKVAYLV